MDLIPSSIIATASFALGLLFIGFVVAIVVRRRLRAKGSVSHSLGLGLLKIQMPKAVPEDNKGGVNEL